MCETTKLFFKEQVWFYGGFRTENAIMLTTFLVTV